MTHSNDICIFSEEKEKRYVAFFKKEDKDELFLKADPGIDLLESYGFLKCSNFDMSVYPNPSLKKITLALKELIENKMKYISLGCFFPFYVGVTYEERDKYGFLIKKFDGIVLKLNTTIYNLTKKFEYIRMTPEVWNYFEQKTLNDETNHTS